MQQQPGSRVSPKLQSCIRDCQNCSSICQSTLQYCQEQGGRHAETTHLQLLRDCANVCDRAANAMMGGANFEQLCQQCAAACERCAQDCDSFGNDATMRACADACRRCAQSCRSVVQAA
jgi:hypothetical protein